MRQFNANKGLTVAEIFPKLQSVELSAVPSTGGETALVLHVDVGLTAAVSLVDGLGGVEEVARQERHHSVTALSPDGEPGGQAGPLPLLAVRQHRALLGEVEQFAQLVGLERGQPQPGLVELLQQEGGPKSTPRISAICNSFVVILITINIKYKMEVVYYVSRFLFKILHVKHFILH